LLIFLKISLFLPMLLFLGLANEAKWLESSFRNCLASYFISKLACSCFKIDTIRSCLVVSSRLDISCVIFSLGNNASKLPLLTYLASFTIFSNSLGFIFAPFKITSLFTLFSSIETRNSVCNSRKITYTLSSSLAKPMFCAPWLMEYS
jgi:hypothetical protein